MADKRQFTKWVLKAASVVVVVLAVRYAFIRGYISQEGIQHFVNQAGVLAAPGFILLVALGIMVFAPPLLLIGSGVLAFGSLMGAVYSSIGVTLGACAAFLLGRYVVKDFALKRKQGRLKKMDEWVELNGLACIVSLRLFLFANPPLNYAASLSSLNLKVYAGGSFVGLLPGVFVISYFFHQMVHATSLRDVIIHPALLSMILLRLLGAAGLVGLAKWYGRGRLVEPGVVPGD